MRKRTQDYEDLEHASQTDCSVDDGNDKKRAGDSSILFLLLIAFVLAAGYLYFYDNVGNESSVAYSSSISSISSKTVFPKGCLLTIPEIDGSSHIVQPPAGSVDLVCCQTSKGVWNIAVHKSWAPIGAANFLSMVKTGFFSSKVGLFRSLKGFLIQFGIAGEPSVQTSFEKNMLNGRHGNLPDDPPWLPLGPPGREINKVRRFQKGYLAYAGAGKNSRGTQLIVAFEDNLYLGGGSPWEVPWGQLIGAESFETLAKIYTGYGEAPSQGKIRNRGKSYLEEEFPLLDYITECQLVREDVAWRSTVTYTSPPAPPPAL